MGRDVTWCIGDLFPLLLRSFHRYPSTASRGRIPRSRCPLWGPIQMITSSVGTANLSQASRITMPLFWFISRRFDNHIMPHQLEGFKIADRINMEVQRTVWSILLGVSESSPLSGYCFTPVLRSDLTICLILLCIGDESRGHTYSNGYAAQLKSITIT